MEWFTGTREHKNSAALIGAYAFFIGLAAGITFIVLAGGDPIAVWISRVLQMLAAAVAGAVIALVLVERLIRRHVLREAAHMHEDLIAALRGDEAQAKQAAEVLAVSGRLRDGTLRGANLIGAHLPARNLSRADLSEARLRAAHLRGADLRKTSLTDADLSLADLRGANLREADLSRARLWMAYLHGADLRQAEIDDAALREAFSLRGALMPDGARYDGRYALPGDLEAAALAGLDPTDTDAMAHWYAHTTGIEAVI
jgi:hypothetical protein